MTKINTFEKNNLPDNNLNKEKESISSGTQKAYTTSYKTFLAWAKDNNKNPETTESIRDFLAMRYSEGKAASTIIKDYFAIKHARCVSGNPISENEDAGINTTIENIRKRLKDRTIITKRAAVAETIKLMAERLDDDLQGLRDRAILFIGYAGMFRRSELAALTIDNISESDNGIYITLSGSHKRDLTRYIEKTGGPFDPVAALYDWIHAAKITEGPIFRALYKGGKLRPQAMSAQSIALIVKDAARKAGLDADEFSGHSLRSGGILESSERGTSVLISHTRKIFN